MTIHSPKRFFKTLKYRPEWPSSGFVSLKVARDWVQNFCHWYNNEHRHSKINFVTPAQRHAGLDVEILRKRKGVLKEKQRLNPIRWSGDVRNCEPIGPVTLNPDREIPLPKEQAA